MWKVIVYVYAAIFVCLFWSLPDRGGKQNRQKKIKTKFLSSSVIFLSLTPYVPRINPEENKGLMFLAEP
jgi:hypothetical protein